MQAAKPSAIRRAVRCSGSGARQRSGRWELDCLSRCSVILRRGATTPAAAALWRRPSMRAARASRPVSERERARRKERRLGVRSPAAVGRGRPRRKLRRGFLRSGGLAVRVGRPRRNDRPRELDSIGPAPSFGRRRRKLRAAALRAAGLPAGFVRRRRNDRCRGMRAACGFEAFARRRRREKITISLRSRRRGSPPWAASAPARPRAGGHSRRAQARSSSSPCRHSSRGRSGCSGDTATARAWSCRR